MKNILVIFFVIFYNLFFSQYNLQYYAVYEASMNLGKNNKRSEEFVLCFSRNQTYFAASLFFNKDYGTDRKPINEIDTRRSYNPERYLSDKGIYIIYADYVNTKIRYSETPIFKWKIQKEFKTINGIKCQKATTTKYGRVWTAFFSEEYPFSFGPLKFNGLPGLIFEVYDDKQDYRFTLTEIKKKQIQLKTEQNKYKNLSKKDYLKARENTEFSMASFPGLPEQERKRFEVVLKDLKEKNNNPIELKPFE